VLPISYTSSLIPILYNLEKTAKIYRSVCNFQHEIIRNPALIQHAHTHADIPHLSCSSLRPCTLWRSCQSTDSPRYTAARTKRLYYSDLQYTQQASRFHRRRSAEGNILPQGKVESLSTSGCYMWWNRVTWQYRYRILSDYCTMWWTIDTWQWRYRIISDYSTNFYIDRLNDENCPLPLEMKAWTESSYPHTTYIKFNLHQLHKYSPSMVFRNQMLIRHPNSTLYWMLIV
jgi:hypothetical protein